MAYLFSRLAGSDFEGVKIYPHLYLVQGCLGHAICNVMRFPDLVGSELGKG